MLTVHVHTYTHVAIAAVTVILSLFIQGRSIFSQDASILQSATRQRLYCNNVIVII